MTLPLQERRRINAVIIAFAQGAVIVDKQWGQNWFVYGRDPSDVVSIGQPPTAPEQRITH